ncbi:MAG: indole-3-glycerol phosphate synthase TrpC [Chloroflexi bacterium]|nr:indole-3-glycerol phosphate synthase TrpC [Chloroflexota bacterium]
MRERSVSILDEIVAWKRVELAQMQEVLPLPIVQARMEAQPSPRDFAAALRSPDGRLRLIAEVKKASPSAGVLRADLDPVAFARAYAHHGAAAISVLTDSRYFQGSGAYLAAIRDALDRDDSLSPEGRPPLLRKDFLFDPYQIYEARAYGADAVLLIVAVLEAGALGYLLELTRSLGMEALVEVHDEEEVWIALEQEASVIGINNRDLRTFTTDLETTRRLRALIPPEVTVVSESGIKGRDDLARLREWGAQAVLIGESIVTAPDVAAKVREFAGLPEDEL